MKKLLFSLGFLSIAILSNATPTSHVDTAAPAFQGHHIMVISMKKEMRDGSEGNAAYMGWKVMSSAAMEIFQNVKPITEADTHGKFKTLPVVYTGKCRIDDTN